MFVKLAQDCVAGFQAIFRDASNLNGLHIRAGEARCYPEHGSHKDSNEPLVGTVTAHRETNVFIVLMLHTETIATPYA